MFSIYNFGLENLNLSIKQCKDIQQTIQNNINTLIPIKNYAHYSLQYITGILLLKYKQAKAKILFWNKIMNQNTNLKKIMESRIHKEKTPTSQTI